jgi:membrane protein
MLLKIIRAFPSLVIETAKRWYTGNLSVYAAALAFYTIFAITPMFIFLVSITGMVFVRQDARDWLFRNIEPFVGTDVLQALENLLRDIQNPPATFIATGLGLLTLYLGAARIVSHLKFSLNSIWKVAPKPLSIRRSITGRLFSFAIVIATGIFLILLAVAGAALTAAGTYLHQVSPGLGPLLKLSDFFITLIIGAVLFAGIFEFLSDACICWKDVWLGSVFTAFLFFIGKQLVGMYIVKSVVSSAYGAAGSLVVIILWIYYSAQILFFGAEFIQVYIERYRKSVSGP